MTISPGQRIRELRILSGLSQEELGRRVGVQRAAINKYEKGTVENIPIKTIEQLARIFDVSPTYIVGWQEFSQDGLATEVKIIQGVKRFYGNDAVDLLETYTNLTLTGKRRVKQYIDDMGRLYEDGNRDDVEDAVN